METDLYKIRSLAHCTKAAYNLFASNQTLLLRRTWLPALLLSFIVAGGHAFSLLFGSALAQHGMGAPGTWWLAVACMALVVAALAAATWLSALVVGLLNGHRLRVNLPRMARLTLLQVGIGMVVTAVVVVAALLPMLAASPTEPLTGIVQSMGSGALALLVLGVCLLPMAYSSMHYCMEPSLRVGSVLGRPYRHGWRHWGLLFAAALLVAIIIGVLDFVAMMPVHVLTLAYAADMQGMALGDASGLPSYFLPMAFAVTWLCTFVVVYVMVWAQLLYYYLYGTIEAKRRLGRQPEQTAADVAATSSALLPTDINLV